MSISRLARRIFPCWTLCWSLLDPKFTFTLKGSQVRNVQGNRKLKSVSSFMLHSVKFHSAKLDFEANDRRHVAKPVSQYPIRLTTLRAWVPCYLWVGGPESLFVSLRADNRPYSNSSGYVSFRGCCRIHACNWEGHRVWVYKRAKKTARETDRGLTNRAK